MKLNGSQWRKKRTIAHWILSQILPNQLDDYTDFWILDKDGKIITFKERKHVVTFSESLVSLVHLESKTKKYSLKEISESVNLLFANRHIELEKMFSDELSKIFIKATPQGRLAYEDLYYINQRKEHWHRDILNTSNWLTPIMTFFVAFVTLLLSLIHCKSSTQTSTATTKHDSTRVK